MFSTKSSCPAILINCETLVFLRFSHAHLLEDFISGFYFDSALLDENYHAKHSTIVRIAFKGKSDVAFVVLVKKTVKRFANHVDGFGERKAFVVQLVQTMRQKIELVPVHFSRYRRVDVSHREIKNILPETKEYAKESTAR